MVRRSGLIRSLKRFNWIVVVSVAAIAGLALGGCGGASDEEVAEAERQGAAREKQQQRLQDLERKLDEGLDQRGQGGSGGRSEPNPPSGRSSAPSVSGSRDCGNSLSSNDVTTCEFAENVRAEYETTIAPASGYVEAYSPARDRYYTMYCTAGTPHECTGGNNAALYFP